MEKLLYKVKATGAKVSVVERLGALTTGMRGFYVQAWYDDEWALLRKTAVFRAGSVTRSVLDVGNTIQIPAEVLVTAGVQLELGFFGEDDTGNLAMPTTWVTLSTITPGVDPSAEEANESLPGLWQQIRLQIGELAALNTLSKENLVAAINEAAKSGGGGSVSEEVIAQLVEEYLQENPPDGGKDGEDGYTPVKGVDYFDGKDGKDGADGEDGISPIVEVAEIDGGHRVTIYDMSGAKTFDVLDGKDGAAGSNGKDGVNGTDGEDGKDGEDGVSCTHRWNGTVLSVTSASGTSSSDLQGPKGDTGNSGVYLGSGDMPEDCNVQIDPDGDALSLDELVNAVIAALPVYDGSVSAV